MMREVPWASEWPTPAPGDPGAEDPGGTCPIASESSPLIVGLALVGSMDARSSHGARLGGMAPSRLIHCPGARARRELVSMTQLM